MQTPHDSICMFTVVPKHVASQHIGLSTKRSHFNERISKTSNFSGQYSSRFRQIIVLLCCTTLHSAMPVSLYPYLECMIHKTNIAMRPNMICSYTAKPMSGHDPNAKGAEPMSTALPVRTLFSKPMYQVQIHTEGCTQISSLHPHKNSLLICPYKTNTTCISYAVVHELYVLINARINPQMFPSMSAPAYWILNSQKLIYVYQQKEQAKQVCSHAH